MLCFQRLSALFTTQRSLIMMDRIISPTPAAAQLLHRRMRNEVSDLHLKQMCCWWLHSSFGACNESDVVFRDAAHIWTLTLEETSECKVLRKGCQQRFTEYDRRKMTALAPRIWVTCARACVLSVILTQRHKRLPSTRLDTAAEKWVQAREPFVPFHQTQNHASTHTHTHTHNLNQLGFLTGTYKVIWACKWQSG